MQQENRRYPELISLTESGDIATGFLVSTQKASNIPFAIKRVFWVHQVPPTYKRGNHAGYKTEEVLIAVRGRVVVQTETQARQQIFTLNRPDLGLYIPAKCWTSLTFSNDALLLVLASSDYDTQDIIADYNQFQQL